MTHQCINIEVKSLLASFWIMSTCQHWSQGTLNIALNHQEERLTVSLTTWSVLTAFVNPITSDSGEHSFASQSHLIQGGMNSSKKGVHRKKVPQEDQMLIFTHDLPVCLGIIVLDKQSMHLDQLIWAKLIWVLSPDHWALTNATVLWCPLQLVAFPKEMKQVKSTASRERSD